MSFADFTLDAFRKGFGISFQQQTLWTAPGSVKPSAWLEQSLERGKSLALVSEKARSEFIVAPMLVECREMLNRSFQIFSGVSLDVDPARGLKGECDFVLAKTPPTPVLQAPVMVILEAKDNDIDEGLGQCAAQMLAAKLYNEKEGHIVLCMHGCVTTGEAWQFMRLQGNDLLIDTKRYYINEADTILGILLTILQAPAPSTQTSDAA